MLLLPTPIAPNRDFYFCLGYRIDTMCSNFFHTSNTSRKIWRHTNLAINIKLNHKEIQFNPRAFFFFFKIFFFHVSFSPFFQSNMKFMFNKGFREKLTGKNIQNIPRTKSNVVKETVESVGNRPIYIYNIIDKGERKFN